MLFSRKALLTKGKKPFYAASTAFAKCHHWSSKRFGRAYSVKPSNDHPDPNNFNEGLYRKIINAWTQTPTKWYPLPLAVGALLLVAIQYRKKRRPEIHVDENGLEVVRLKGPWQVHVMGSLPLRNMSRLWGYVNSLELPVWFRPYGFKLYAYAFGCNLDEIELELSAYKSLGDFFERRLREGVRPIDDAILVSPADGTVLHFGTVENSRVEQVKGLTYSLDALLGVERPGSPAPAHAIIHNMPTVDDREFANVNGIEYTLDQLIGTPGSGTSTPTEETPRKFGQRTDESVVEPDRNVTDTLAHDTNVALQMGVKPTLTRTQSSTATVKPGHSLYFAVIYLAPGDYHRFHSPTAWVVEKRRHFPGELFSVSPFMAKRLENLFVLNERVAMLGRWRHGFFGMIPVGATNVGSIKVNFDQALRTNLRRRRRDRNTMPPGSYTEAVYSAASPVLNGQPLTYAQEMGGFCLGSTIVLVFEAPDDFEFDIKAEQKVKVGQGLGHIRNETVVAAPTPHKLNPSPLKFKAE